MLDVQRFFPNNNLTRKKEYCDNLKITPFEKKKRELFESGNNC